MSEQSYMVVFRGELVEGTDAGHVKEKLQALSKLSAEKVEQLFSLPAVVLKKNLTEGAARAFQQQLESIGVVSEVRLMDEAKVVKLSQPAPSQETENSEEGKAPPKEAHTITEQATAASEVNSSDSGDSLQVQFHGSGGEYFKIWIVNIFLTILTLGIYSAWAKVRNHRYFYSNTQIGQGSFEYTADPVAILKGRIIAVFFLLLFNYAGSTLPFGGILYGLLVIVFIVALPWLITRSMAFRNRNTRYRNVRFGFTGEYFDAMKAFVLWPVAGALSFGILMPYAIFRQKQFLVSGSRYGTTVFEPEFGWREVYGIALRALLILIATVLLFVIPFVGPLLGLVGYLVIFAYFNANMGNLVYNGSSLVSHRFESTLETKKLAIIYLVNWISVALTLGLAYPWAKVRLAKYRADNLKVITDGSLDAFIAGEEEQVNSLGEEIGEAFDIDIGL